MTYTVNTHIEAFVIDGTAVMTLMFFLLFTVFLYKSNLYLQHTGWTETTGRMIDVDSCKSQTVLHTALPALMFLIALVPPLYQVD